MEPIRKLSSEYEAPYRYLRDLPDFLFFEIFTYLSSVQVCTARLVCQRWKRIAEDRLIWKQLFRKQFPLAFPNLSPDLDFLEVYCSIQRKIKVSSQIRFNKYRIEEEPKIVNPRFKWPWLFGANGRSVILWNVETKKTHLLQLQTFFNEERPFLQPLAIKKGFIYIKTAHPLGKNDCTLHEVHLTKGIINQSFRPPQEMGRMLHFKKMALYYFVHNAVHVWPLSSQSEAILIKKSKRILSMYVKGNYIAVVNEDRTVDLHDRLTGRLLHTLPKGSLFISLGKNMKGEGLLFTLNQAQQAIESYDVHSLRLITTYPFQVISQGYNQMELSEVVADEDFLVVKVIHTQVPPIPGQAEKQTTLEFFDIETGSSISVIKLEKEPFNLFFKNGKIFYHIRESGSGKEKIKTEWVDFSNEKYLKRKGCVIS